MAFLETCQFDFTLERIKSRILPQPEERTPLLTDIPEEGDDEGTKYNSSFRITLLLYPSTVIQQIISI